jgi:hypothetical protein
MPEKPKPAAAVIAMIPVAVACLILGAFTGCDFDLLIFGTRPGGGVGLLVGALVGLALGVWLGARRWAARPRSAAQTVRATLLFGIAWLAVSAAGFLTGWRIGNTHQWVPVRVPIRFDRANSVEVAFVAGMSERYDVLLDLKKKIPFDGLDAFTGGFGGMPLSEEARRLAPPRPEIVWKVSGVAWLDQFHDWRAVSYRADSVGLSLGWFMAVEGRRYTVEFTVVQPSAPAQVLEPELKIEIPRIVRSDSYVPAMIAMMSGMIAFLVGMGLVVRAFLLGRAL